MTADERTALMRLLTSTVDAYGGDVTRWPERSREALAAFVREDRDARRVLREATALDRLLTSAADTRAAEVPLALMSRIVAAAQASAPDRRGSAGTGPGAEVVTLPTGNRWTGTLPAPDGPTDHADLVRRRMWPSLGVLAASLLLGLYIGGTGQLDQALGGLSTLAGQTASVEQRPSSLVLPISADEPGVDELL